MHQIQILFIVTMSRNKDILPADRDPMRWPTGWTKNVHHCCKDMLTKEPRAL